MTQRNFESGPAGKEHDPSRGTDRISPVGAAGKEHDPSRGTDRISPVGAAPVSSERYSKEYFLGNCGGSEFFHRYGPAVLKPTMAYSFSRAQIRPGMRALDLGCGRGELLFHVRKEGGVGIGTDYALPALKIAAEVSGCPVVLCDAKFLPFHDKSFDRVFFLGVIDHLHEWELEACFKEIGRVLKDDGFAVIHTCVNKLYYKTLTYRWRRSAAKALRALGLAVREPSPPRSDEDEALHVNEHSFASLAAFFKRIGWRAVVEARPNYKLVLNRIYGAALPPDFPLKPASRLKSFLYLNLLWRTPLKRVLAREFFCLASPLRTAPAER